MSLTSTHVHHSPTSTTTTISTAADSLAALRARLRFAAAATRTPRCPDGRPVPSGGERSQPGAHAVGDQSGGGAQQRRSPQPVGPPALHRGDQQHAEPAVGAVPLAEDGSGERGGCGEFEPVGGRRPRGGQLHRPQPAEPSDAECGGHVVGGGRCGGEADGGRHEDREEHGERGDGDGSLAASEHDQQARRHGDPRRGVGDGRQAHDESAQRWHRHGDERGDEGDRPADHEPACGRRDRGGRSPPVRVAAVADERAHRLGGRDDHAAGPPGSAAPHPQCEEQHDAGGRGGERLDRRPPSPAGRVAHENLRKSSSVV